MPDERRTTVRTSPADTWWSARAVLRPGHEVTILDVGSGGVRLATQVALRPGRRVELQLVRGDAKHLVGGRVVRCQLVSLTPPVYHVAIALGESLPMLPA